MMGPTSESTTSLDVAANPVAVAENAPDSAPIAAPSAAGAAPVAVPTDAPADAPVAIPLAAPAAAPVAAPVTYPAAVPVAAVDFSPMAALMASSVENFEPQCWSGVQNFCTVKVGFWEWVVTKARKVFTPTRSDSEADEGEPRVNEAHATAGPSGAVTREVCVCHPLPNSGSDSDSD